MIKDFSISKNVALINFTAKYCKSEREVLNSRGFSVVITHYLQYLKKRDEVVYDELLNICEKHNKIIVTLTNIFKLLLSFNSKEIEMQNAVYKQLLYDKRDVLVSFIEGMYNYWRTIERYALIRSPMSSGGLQTANFIEATDDFTNLVLKTYRQIQENVEAKYNRVYRQLTAGVNAGIILHNSRWETPNKYKFLQKVPFISEIILRPPFIAYPNRNKRSGVFQDLGSEPWNDSKLNPNHWFCYPARIGEYLAYVYFHREFMIHGVSLCNLFELAEPSFYTKRNPDLVYIFGSKDQEGKKIGYFHDKDNDIMVGYANNNEDFDYFGYMKKMLLTLHNLKQIKNGYLPIHGAMVNVVLKDGTESNIVIMGDSGAGKSESLEAFRHLSEKYLKSIKIIFDDMGTFKIENNKLIGYGTEIGAFVRLDDLDAGYAYEEIDRAVFMNPDKINARLIIPVSKYKEVIKGYQVDLFLYANNYDDVENVIEYFENPKLAKEIFVEGKRAAKGTTTEIGIVKSFFANPFGPVQQETKTRQIIDKYFDFMFSSNIKVGQIYTKLAIDGMETKGPLNAAAKLFEVVKENK